MAPSIIYNDAVQDEVFLPGQIFVFGGFALRANSLGHLEHIESYAPGHQVRFGSLNYTADIHGDLIFDGFEPQPSAPHCHDGHDLALEAALEPAPILNSKLAAQIEDGWLDFASGAATPTAIEPNTDLVPHEALFFPRCRTPCRTPNLPRPLQSDLIGRRSWSSPQRTSFNTHLSTTS